MVIREVLRICPSFPVNTRVCTTESVSLEPFSDFKVPKGMPILIPNYCLQNDDDVSVELMVLLGLISSFVH